MRRPSRRFIGRSMIAIGVAGIVVSLTSVIVGQAMIQQVRTSVDDSLVLTSEALRSVSDSIAVTESIVTTVRSGMGSIGTTMATVEDSLNETSKAIANTGDFLGGSLADSLEAVNGVLPTIESIANSVDSALRVLEKAPFGPDYDPVQPFDEAIAEVTAALGPIPEDLRALSQDISGLDESTTLISEQVGVLADDIAELDAQLGDVSDLLVRYRATAESAELLAADSRSDLEASAKSTRLLLILLGAVFALGQIVPIWLGSVLLSDNGPNRIITRRRDDELSSSDAVGRSPIDPPTEPPSRAPNDPASGSVAAPVTRG